MANPTNPTNPTSSWDARVHRLREAVRRYEVATRKDDRCERETLAMERRRRRARARQRVEEEAARIEALCDAETTFFIADGAIGDEVGSDASLNQPSARDVTRLLDDDDDDDEETVESPTTMRRAARDVVERARREYRSRRALEKTHASASSIDRSLEETRRALDAARVLDDDEDDELVEIDALLRACRR